MPRFRRSRMARGKRARNFARAIHRHTGMWPPGYAVEPAPWMRPRRWVKQLWRDAWRAIVRAVIR